MEVSVVRQRVRAAMERAKRGATERQARADEAEKAYPAFLNQVAVPIFRQVAAVLKADGYHFTVFTPGSGVRLMSDKSSDDFIELALDTTSERPTVIGHVKRGRGRRVIETERPIGDASVRELTEDTVLEFLLEEIEPFVER